MKKLLLILVLFLYLIPAIGVTVSVHYCKGELARISFGSEQQQEQTCGCKISSVRKKCCENVVLSMKIKDDQQKVKPTLFDFSHPAELLTKPEFFLRFVAIVTEKSSVIHPIEIPPGRSKQPLYLQHSSFLI